MLTYPSQQGRFQQSIKLVCKKCKRKRAPTKEKPGLRRASTGQMIATETRPRADMHGKRQTLPQVTLPEQAGYLASCQKYAPLKPDRSGQKYNGMDLTSKFPR